MCLTIPMKVLAVRGDRATVESPGGPRDVDVSHVIAREGAYVLVQGGVAVMVLEIEDARAMLAAWDEVDDPGRVPDA